MAPLAATTVGSAITDNLFTFDPVPIVVLVMLAALYLRAVDVLRGRNRRVPLLQQASFFGGLLLIAIGLLSFPDALAGQLLSMHMAQHMLLADLSAPLLLIGVRAPVLYFFWPKPILVAAARTKVLRLTWSFLTRPPIAVTTWLVILFAWHVPGLYDLALRRESVHVLEHAMFAFGGFLAFWPILDPTHHRFEARVWKSLYVIAARLIGGILGLVLLLDGNEVYGFYGDRARSYGTTPLADQSVAGAIMMAVDFVFMMSAFFLIFLQLGGAAARQDEVDREAQLAAARRVAARNGDAAPTA